MASDFFLFSDLEIAMREAVGTKKITALKEVYTERGFSHLIQHVPASELRDFVKELDPKTIAIAQAYDICRLIISAKEIERDAAEEGDCLTARRSEQLALRLARDLLSTIATAKQG